MCPNYHFRYLVDRKQRKIGSWREEREVCEEIGTGGLRRWWFVLFCFLINFVFSYKLALSVWLKPLSNWLTDLMMHQDFVACICGRG